MNHTVSPPNSRSLIAWHCLAVALFLLVPTMVQYRTPFWSLPARELQNLLVLVTGYAISAFLITVGRRRGWAQHTGVVIATSCAVFGLIFLGFLLAPANRPRGFLLVMFGLTPLLLVMASSARSARVLTAMWVAALVSLAASVSQAIGIHVPRNVGTKETIVSTALYDLRIIEHHRRVPTHSIPGGGITAVSDRYLLGTGDGRLYSLRWNDPGNALTIEPLSIRVPLNADEFAADVDAVVDWKRFRVADVLAYVVNDRVRVLASHHYWKRAEACFVVRVSMFEATVEALISVDQTPSWKTVFESTPCLPIKRGGTAFAGNLVGGRMWSRDDGSVLLTVGDHEFDGWNSERILAQDRETSYGKILLLFPSHGGSEIFSRGHRNPQGLYTDRTGFIWSTEHGPRGGDELNRILREGNYGWPFATYGTEYGAYEWPMSRQLTQDDDFKEPVYAWLPSIGVSNLIGVEQDLFSRWKGDLLVASLADRHLRRVKLRDGRVVFVEPIEIGKRIRDLIETRDGRILLWTDDGSILTIEPASESDANGELLFARGCRGCHSTKDGTSHAVGPDLWNIQGRRVASALGYGYSDALLNLDWKWDDEHLNAFLANPQSVAPGTSMAVEGIGDPAVRSAVVTYMNTLR